MTKYAYYPGCSLETSAKDYDASVRSVFAKLGLELTEIEDWSCCGSSPTHKLDKDLASLVAGRNLALAQGSGQIVAPCASCSSNLKQASIELDKSEALRQALALANYNYEPGSVRVVSAVEAVYRALKDGLFDGKVKTPLTGLKVASYYGCLLVRPTQVADFDDPEDPTSMDEIASFLGATPVGFSHKTECCGNSYILVDKDMAQHLVANILNAAIDAGADVIATACPLCQQNLALRQGQLKKDYGLKREIAVVYFTQLMGMGVGINASELGLEDSVVELIGKRREKQRND